MTARMDLAEPFVAVRHFYWLPLLLAVVGALAGFGAGTGVPAVYRAEATVLVGPTDGSVTHTATIRTSEDLAAFYADMARREIVLNPVVRSLDLHMSWDQLRNRVGATVPDQNLRLVTVTILGNSPTQAKLLANGVVDELVSLSPVTPGGSDQAFVNAQARQLQETITAGQQQIDDWRADLSKAAEPEDQRQLRGEINAQEQLVADWQRTYVELIAAEPSSDAGGLQILDHASMVEGMGRSGPARQAALGAAVGAMLGSLIAWVAYRRRLRQEAPHRAAPLMGRAPSPADREPRPGTAATTTYDSRTPQHAALTPAARTANGRQS